MKYSVKCFKTQEQATAYVAESIAKEYTEGKNDYDYTIKHKRYRLFFVTILGLWQVKKREKI
jgi:hypothetical protein